MATERKQVQDFPYVLHWLIGAHLTTLAETPEAISKQDNHLRDYAKIGNIVMDADVLARAESTIKERSNVEGKQLANMDLYLSGYVLAIHQGAGHLPGGPEAHTPLGIVYFTYYHAVADSYYSKAETCRENPGSPDN